MKCDELKAYNVVATADVNPEVVDSLGCTEWAGYDKNEVDAAIAELKGENRKLKRALWLTRGNINEIYLLIILFLVIIASLAPSINSEINSKEECRKEGTINYVS